MLHIGSVDLMIGYGADNWDDALVRAYQGGNADIIELIRSPYSGCCLNYRVFMSPMPHLGLSI